MGVNAPAPRFGAIGGTGWLGSALVASALRMGVIASHRTCISTRSGNRGGLAGLEGLTFTSDNAALAEASDIILLTVRPQDLDAVKLDLTGKLVLSVMAMVPLAALEARFGKARYIRAMPNAAAEQGLSFTPLLAGASANGEDISFATTFFSASGMVERVESEALLDYLTGLTGSGPAFFASLAAAMERDAVARGLAPALARRAISQLLRGAMPQLTADGSAMAEIVSTFKAYRGTTAAGLDAMEQSGLEALVHAMLAAAENKAAHGL